MGLAISFWNDFVGKSANKDITNLDVWINQCTQHLKTYCASVGLNDQPSKSFLMTVARLVRSMYLSYYGESADKNCQSHDSGVMLWEHKWKSQSGVMTPRCLHGKVMQKLTLNTEYLVDPSSAEGIEALKGGAQLEQKFKSTYVKVVNNDKIGCFKDLIHDAKKTRLDHATGSCGMIYNSKQKAITAFQNYMESMLCLHPQFTTSAQQKMLTENMLITSACFCTSHYESVGDLSVKKGRQLCKITPFQIGNAAHLSDLQERNQIEQVIVDHPCEVVFGCRNPSYSSKGKAASGRHCNFKLTAIDLKKAVTCARIIMKNFVQANLIDGKDFSFSVPILRFDEKTMGYESADRKSVADLSNTSDDMF